MSQHWSPRLTRWIAIAVILGCLISLFAPTSHPLHAQGGIVLDGVGDDWDAGWQVQTDGLGRGQSSADSPLCLSALAVTARARCNLRDHVCLSEYAGTEHSLLSSTPSGSQRIDPRESRRVPPGRSWETSLPFDLAGRRGRPHVSRWLENGVYTG